MKRIDLTTGKQFDKARIRNKKEKISEFIGNDILIHLTQIRNQVKNIKLRLNIFTSKKLPYIA